MDALGRQTSIVYFRTALDVNARRRPEVFIYKPRFG